MSGNFIADVPADVLAAIEDLARLSHRTPASVATDALRAYLAGEGLDVVSASRGRADIAAGRFEDFDVLIADIETIVGGKAA